MYLRYDYILIHRGDFFVKNNLGEKLHISSCFLPNVAVKPLALAMGIQGNPFLNLVNFI